MTAVSLPKLCQPALKALVKDLLERSRSAGVEAGLRAAWEAEQRAGETGSGFDPWRRERVTQIAVAWVLSIVFVRTLEDRELIDPRVSGPDAAARRVAEDRESTFTQVAPFLGPREYLLTVFRELAKLPGSRHVFDQRHNAVWVLSPSSLGARALLDFFRKPNADGRTVLTFGGTDTRFLGDLYQNLSEDARKRYALLQTPEFIEEFILDQTLDPAIEEFGLEKVRLIDPTCGSGHFLLGAFRRLLSRWQTARPAEPIEDLARRALDQVYGVDINPYAIAIARFRLVLAVLDAVGVRRLDKAPDVHPNLVVADSLLHRFEENRSLDDSGPTQLTFEAAWGDELFRLEDPTEVERVLSRRYHAVVGNPPFITEKDAAKRKKFIQMYVSASGQYTLAAPFTERFFELARGSGFVGLINMNAWTKRDYGKALIEVYLPRVEITKIVDVSGAYIPSNGSRSLMLFGRHREPSDAPVPAVLGKRGEREEPSNPATAPVWLEISGHHDDVGFEGTFVSIEEVPRPELASHPWILAGGGARSLLSHLKGFAEGALRGLTSDDIGYSLIIGEDDAFIRPPWAVNGLPSIPVVTGEVIRDWECVDTDLLLRPFRLTDFDLDPPDSLTQHLWPWRRVLECRIVSGSTSIKACGRAWFDLRRFSKKKHETALTIAYGEVATHNHFVLERGGKLFKQTAPVIKLANSLSEQDHLGLLGYLNSSTMAFWGRLVFYQHGDKMGEGARLSKTPWQDRIQMAGTILQQLPVPRLTPLSFALLDLVVLAERTVHSMRDVSPEASFGATVASTPTLSSLRSARDLMVTERERLRGILVSLQEEMDWRVYGLFGLPTVTADSVEAVTVPVEPNNRPFEVRLAREVDSDISAAEWFRIHKRTPPADVGGPLEDLYRQRLRLLDDPVHGKDLRLLETPETKRRWSSPDDAKAFADAARSWLLDRVERVFREQAQPELQTARQIALDLGHDRQVQAVHELLTEETGNDLVRLVADLLDAEGVPFLSALRYSETGREKRKGWEECWELQRAEDAGRLDALLAAQKLKAIPVPDKYEKTDFQRHYWSHRGELDVPKERFFTVPVGSGEDDPTPLVGWAGWDHLQAARAISGLYQRRKTEDGWSADRLVPLLAGLDERVPWVLQWHNDPSDAFNGTKLGDYLRDFVAGEAHDLGVSLADLRTWRPAAAGPNRGRRAALSEGAVLDALAAWAGEGDPRPEDLAQMAGAARAAVAKVLESLVKAGDVVRTNGRPARFRHSEGRT